MTAACRHRVTSSNLSVSLDNASSLFSVVERIDRPSRESSVARFVVCKKRKKARNKIKYLYNLPFDVVKMKKKKNIPNDRDCVRCQDISVASKFEFI